MSRGSLITRINLWLLPVIYVGVIFHFSSESNPLPALTTHVWDKLLHLIEFGGLAALLCRALRGEGLGWIAAIAGAIALTSIYGATDEWHQLYTPGREADVHDWLADTLGGTVGTLGYRLAWLARPVSRRASP
jgi:VanZ family protein